MLKTETTADGPALINVFGIKLAESALEQTQKLLDRARRALDRRRHPARRRFPPTGFNQQVEDVLWRCR